ncbi:MAG: N-acetyltransferase family protein [Thermoplasmata archaeon]
MSEKGRRIRSERRPTIRAALPTDVDAIAAIYNEAVRTTTATFDTEPRSVEEQSSWLAHHDSRHPVLVAQVGREVVGWACLSPWSERRAYAATTEISVYVASEWRGRGIGRYLVAEIRARATALGIHTILARIAEGNPVSRQLHLSAGFTTVGVMREVGFKFGRLIDVELMQLTLPKNSVKRERPRGAAPRPAR